MPKDFNQSTSPESYLKLQLVDSNTSTIIISTLFVSNINTDCVQLFDSLFHTGAPNENFRKNICSQDDLRSRIFGSFFVRFVACLPLLGFSNI